MKLLERYPRFRGVLREGFHCILHVVLTHPAFGRGESEEARPLFPILPVCSEPPEPVKMEKEEKSEVNEILT